MEFISWGLIVGIPIAFSFVLIFSLFCSFQCDSLKETIKPLSYTTESFISNSSAITGFVTIILGVSFFKNTSDAPEFLKPIIISSFMGFFILLGPLMYGSLAKYDSSDGYKNKKSDVLIAAFFTLSGTFGQILSCTKFLSYISNLEVEIKPEAIPKVIPEVISSSPIPFSSLLIIILALVLIILTTIYSVKSLVDIMKTDEKEVSHLFVKRQRSLL